MTEINIDESVILFGVPKYHFGQKVKVDCCVGYVIGLQRGKYVWSYLFVEGDRPGESSSENWYDEHSLTANN